MTNEEKLDDNISIEEFRHWQKNAVTKKTMDILKKRCKEYEQSILNGLIFTDNEHHKCIYARGKRDAYQELLNINFQDIERDV